MIKAHTKTITFIGTLPPVTGISPYCIGFIRQYLSHTKVSFVAIGSPYPSFLYPGTLRDPSSIKLLEALTEDVTIKRSLVWWNPLSWIRAGFRIKTESVYINWWTVALFPMLFTIALILKARNKQTTAIVHNPIGHESFPGEKFLTRLFLARCQAYIVLTSAGKRFLSDHYRIPDSRITVIYHPTLDFYPHKDIDKSAARTKLDIPQDAAVYLFFGHIRQYKSLSTIIKSFGDIARKDPEAVLVIAGEPWIDFSTYKELIDQHGLTDSTKLYLEFIPTSQVSYFFRAADTLILANTDQGSASGVKALAEGFDLPVLDLSKDPEF